MLTFLKLTQNMTLPKYLTVEQVITIFLSKTIQILHFSDP